MTSNELSSVLQAGIRPSFTLDYSAWHATNIAVVLTTRQDGVFRVVESWKGEWRPGDFITAPELTPTSDTASISAQPKRKESHGDGHEPGFRIPRKAPGSRMVLFLKSNRVADQPFATARLNAPNRWLPSSFYDDFRTSVVWLDHRGVHAFEQLMNPGPSVLTALDVSESKLRDRVAETCRIQRDLDETIKIQDGDLRARGLKSYLHSDVIPARQLAMTELRNCGPSAIATIRGTLDDTAYTNEASEIVKAYIATGGESVSEDLDRRLREQVTFWRATAPSLRQGWWNEIPIPEALRARYMVTRALVLALQETHYTQAITTATELRDLWRSLPQLDDPSGLNQMAEECNRLISRLETSLKQR